MTRRVRSAAVLLFPFLIYAAEVKAVSPEPQEACRITKEGWIGNDELRVGSPGRLVFQPGGPGFVTSDGALGWKFLWRRLVEGRLHVEGRRLDGPSSPLRVEVADAYGIKGIQPTYLIFPQPGCWEITARVQDNPLSMVVLVEKIAIGPSWRRR